MLTKIKIINYLLIEHLELDFDSGFTVVTGETGSGKSIIIDALMIVFGLRFSTDMIRTSQNQAIFEAEFELTNSTVIDWLEDNDLSFEDNPAYLLCRRVIDKNGKNKIYINGNIVAVAQIKYIGECLLDVHTQHASITLLKQDMQRKLLDEYAGLVDKGRELNIVYKRIGELENKIDILESESKNQEFKKQYLNEMLIELKKLELRDSEWVDLDVLHKQLANANLVLQELDVVNNAIDGSEESLRGSVSKLLSRLAKLEQIVPAAKKIIELINSIDIEIVEISHEINAIVNRIDEDPEKLKEVENRINAIYEMGRKYKILPNNILDEIAIIESEILLLNLDNDINILNKQLLIEEEQYHGLACEISKFREKSATLLSQKITQLLHELAITGSFEIKLIKQELRSSFGYENIEYYVGFNRGIVIQPLARTASGGELSRTALAVYLTLSMHNPPEIIIFDEIDVGIGGKVAAIVGKMLKILGVNKQVICITHQPQTASFGDNHLVVSKSLEKDCMKLCVSKMVSTDRVQEIARMLSGMQVTEATIKHAKDMLNLS